jgi:hypothetical protein
MDPRAMDPGLMAMHAVGGLGMGDGPGDPGGPPSRLHVLRQHENMARWGGKGGGGEGERGARRRAR